jgi:hypothetical protein
MPPFADAWKCAPLAVAALACSLGIRSDALPHPQGRLAELPRITLWAWERREDLRTLDPRRFAVAYLDRTLTIDLTVKSQLRQNPVVLPALAVRIPVVRIETGSLALFNDDNREEIVRNLLLAAREPGISALQIDFDATRSQRQFYRDVIVDVRRQMPADMPLSITALASWCSYDDWLRGLPIDEAVPMMFRMEPDRKRAPANLDDFRIREPLCEFATGISTTESWPSNLAGKRIYVFPDEGWQVDSPFSIERRLQ